MNASMHLRESDKIILPAIVLCAFFGVFGAHRLYLRRYPTAILQILTLGGLGIWSLVDLILLATGEMNDAQGRKVRNWVTSARESEMVELLKNLNFTVGRLDQRVQTLETIVIEQESNAKWEALER